MSSYVGTGLGGEGSKKEKVGRIVRGGVGYHWAERCKKKGEGLWGEAMAE
jgi:hypothetical protein